jgi:hypothetical protein
MLLAPNACVYSTLDHQPDSESNQGDLSVAPPSRPRFLGDLNNDLQNPASGRIKILIFAYDYLEIGALISLHESSKSESGSGSNWFGRANILAPRVFQVLRIEHDCDMSDHVRSRVSALFEQMSVRSSAGRGGRPGSRELCRDGPPGFPIVQAGTFPYGPGLRHNLQPMLLLCQPPNRPR